jgi:exodeoxyribonuclease V alpha subunit
MIQVMNGEVGIITRMNLSSIGEEEAIDIWAQESPVLWVRYPLHDMEVAYTKSTLKELQLAYAITVHKSIGSEFKAVVLVLSHTRDEFMRRQLPYTAITRASEMCVVISTTGAFEKFVANSQKFKRFSLLAKLLTS